MEDQNAQNNRKKKRAALMVAGIAFLAGGIALSLYLHYKAYHISTDDAFIDGHVYTVSSRVGGIVESVMVEDNQFVEKDDLLLSLDPDDYELRVKAEEAALEESRARLSELEAKVKIGKFSLSEASSMVEAARANLELKQTVQRKAEQDFQRAKVLFEKEVLSKESHDNAATAYDVAVADSRAASEKLKQAEQAMEIQRAMLGQYVLEVKTQRSKIEQKVVALDAAALAMSYTSINAPGSGRVTKKNVERGSHVSAGQPLMAVVDLDKLWITANYKETDLGKISPGLHVRFRVDAWPGVVFNGTVDSIMAGTGAAFSVFPSENATGNYVKVVQRVPVKIVPEENAFRQYKPRVGMSVVPVINLR